MNINVIFGLGAANNAAPTGFYTAVDYVVSYLDQLFTNNVTININIGYGSLLDPYTGTYSGLSGGALGESYTSNDSPTSYSAVRSVLQGENAPGSQTLPANSPVPGTLYMGSAEAKALGLIGASTALDGAIGVSASTAWDFTPNTTPTASEFYLVGVLEHEITEVMGRVSSLDTPGTYSVADLYRYSAPGVRDISAGGSGSTAYFSLDNGVTNLGTWNNQTSNGDLGDWYPQGPAPGGNDAFNDYSSSGVINVMSSSDIALMNALGWTTAPSASLSATSGIVVAAHQSASVSSLFAMSNPNGDTITQYSFEDLGGGSGHFAVAGTVEPSGQTFTVNAANLSGVQYFGGDLAGTETLSVNAYDATIGAWLTPISVTAVTTAPFPIANNFDVTEAVYIGYFGRAGDASGQTYWVNQLNSGNISASGMAASFSLQAEAASLYPFLTSPTNASQSQISSFIGSVYQDLFNRAPDPGGSAYWQNYLTSNLMNPQAIGAFILNVLSGAQGSDQTTIVNKVTVADYLTQALVSGGLSFTSSANTLAHNVVTSVTSDPSTVLNAESTINSWLSTQSVAVGSVGTSDSSVVGAHLA